jgi:hypothetical protein
MPGESFRVARMNGDRLEILGEFEHRHDALDMADRAKYMWPIVFFVGDDGEVEVVTATSAHVMRQDVN